MTEIVNEKIGTPVGAGGYTITTQTPEGPKPVELSTRDQARVERETKEYQQDAARMMTRVDRQTQQTVQQLQRQQKEQEEQLQRQRDEIAADEARALDNQALVSALQGEKGGMQQAQQKVIRRTAAKNRRLVNEAQKKLAAETARQIDQLRADGEFEKADALLDLNQELERSLWDVLVQVAEGIMEPEEVEPAVQAMTAPQQETTPAQTANPAPQRTTPAQTAPAQTAADTQTAASGNAGMLPERLQKVGTVAEEAMQLGTQSMGSALGYLMELVDAEEMKAADVDYIYTGLMQGRVPTSYQDFLDLTDWSGILTEEAFLRDEKVNRNYLGYQDYLIRMYIQHG